MRRVFLGHKSGFFFQNGVHLHDLKILATGSDRIYNAKSVFEKRLKRVIQTEHKATRYQLQVSISSGN